MAMKPRVTDIITEKTLIPISLISIVCGGMMWLSAMWYKTEATASELVEVKSEVRKLQVDVIDRLARIETKLDSMKSPKSKER